MLPASVQTAISFVADAPSGSASGVSAITGLENNAANPSGNNNLRIEFSGKTK
jgi:hypothetical protein